MTYKFETELRTAPAHWAYYLCNEDGVLDNEDDIERANKWETELASEGWYITDVNDDAIFRVTCDAYGGPCGEAFNGDVCTYVLSRQIEDKP